ncbi:MAG: DMT family transporter [Sneathiella sp.]|nr:DMT family transporter [Sneathiella sp.]
MKPQHLALMLMINVLWASNFLAAKVGMTVFPPLFFTAIRFLMVVVILLPFVRWPHGYWVKLLQVGFLMGVLHYSLMFWGLAIAEEISPVAILNQVFVPFSTLLAILVLKEQVGWKRWAAILLSFAGVMVIGFDSSAFDTWLAPVLVISASLFLSLNLIVVRTMPGIGALNLTFWTAAIGMIPLFILSMIFEDGHAMVLATADVQHWSGVVYSAIGASVIGHGAANYLIQHYPVSMIAPYYMLVPVFAVILGVAFWGDQITISLLIGGGMVMAGVATITLRNSVR